MPALVSVVVPAYNARQWIADTLDSVYQQSYPREQFEIVVIDDDSADDTRRVIRSLIERGEASARMIKHPRNLGVSAARNTGWRSAHGEWIQFLDADDLLAPHKLALQMDCAMRLSSHVDVIYSDWQELSLDDDTWRPRGPVFAPFVDDSPVLRILQGRKFGYLGPTLIRKQMLQSIGGFDEQLRIGEDLDLMLRMAMSGGSFRHAASDAPTFFYRLTPSSLWRQSVAQLEQMRRLLFSLRQVEAFLRAQSVDDAVDERAADALTQYYSKLSEFVDDPRTLFEIAQWIAGLGGTYSPDLSRNMRLVSRFIGWQNAVRLRALYRRQALRLRTSAT
jgi:hypothetical protein